MRRARNKQEKSPNFGPLLIKYVLRSEIYHKTSGFFHIAYRFPQITNIFSHSHNTVRSTEERSAMERMATRGFSATSQSGSSVDLPKGPKGCSFRVLGDAEAPKQAANPVFDLVLWKSSYPLPPRMQGFCCMLPLLSLNFSPTAWYPLIHFPHCRHHGSAQLSLPTILEVVRRTQLPWSLLHSTDHDPPRLSLVFGQPSVSRTSERKVSKSLLSSSPWHPLLFEFRSSSSDHPDAILLHASSIVPPPISASILSGCQDPLSYSLLLRFSTTPYFSR